MESSLICGKDEFGSYNFVVLVGPVCLFMEHLGESWLFLMIFFSIVILNNIFRGVLLYYFSQIDS